MSVLRSPALLLLAAVSSTNGAIMHVTNAASSTAASAANTQWTFTFQDTNPIAVGDVVTITGLSALTNYGGSTLSWTPPPTTCPVPDPFTMTDGTPGTVTCNPSPPTVNPSTSCTGQCFAPASGGTFILDCQSNGQLTVRNADVRSPIVTGTTITCANFIITTASFPGCICTANALGQFVKCPSNIFNAATQNCACSLNNCAVTGRQLNGVSTSDTSTADFCPGADPASCNAAAAQTRTSQSNAGATTTATGALNTGTIPTEDINPTPSAPAVVPAVAGGRAGAHALLEVRSLLQGAVVVADAFDQATGTLTATVQGPANTPIPANAITTVVATFTNPASTCPNPTAVTASVATTGSPVAVAAATPVVVDSTNSGATNILSCPNVQCGTECTGSNIANTACTCTACPASPGASIQGSYTTFSICGCNTGTNAVQQACCQSRLQQAANRGIQLGVCTCNGQTVACPSSSKDSSKGLLGLLGLLALIPLLLCLLLLCCLFLRRTKKGKDTAFSTFDPQAAQPCTTAFYQ